MPGYPFLDPAPPGCHARTAFGLRTPAPRTAGLRVSPSAATDTIALAFRLLGRLRSGALLGQVADHGQDAPVVVVAGRQAQLGVDVGDVLDDGPLGQRQGPGDGDIAAAFGHQREYLLLAGGEPP